jgi:hypothetical protein
MARTRLDRSLPAWSGANEPESICRWCSEVVDSHDGVLFGLSGPADIHLDHLECVAVETLKLIYQREVEHALGGAIMSGSMDSMSSMN